MKEHEYESEVVPLDKLDPAEYNPRKIKPAHLEKLRASIRDFGMVDPIIVNKRNNRIVGGHMRRQAADDLGITEVPVSWVWCESDEEEMALNVALNNAELAGEWDTSKLVEILEKVQAKSAALLANTGFEGYQLERFQRQVEDAKSKPVYPLASKMLEHYDYVVIFCKNEVDFANLRTVLGVVTEKSYKKEKKGLGRVVPYEKFIARWEGRDAATAAVRLGQGEAEGGEGPDRQHDAESGREAAQGVRGGRVSKRSGVRVGRSEEGRPGGGDESGAGAEGPGRPVGGESA